MIAELILVGSFTITAYQATPAQTKPTCRDNWHCETSIGDKVTPVGCAVSQDLLKDGTFKYHEWIYVEGFGYRYVNDTMNPRIKRAIDLFAWTPADEKKVGVRHKAVYKLTKSQPRREEHAKSHKAGRSGVPVQAVLPQRPRVKKNSFPQFPYVE